MAGDGTGRVTPLHACVRSQTHILKKAGKGVFIWKKVVWPMQN